MPQDSSSQAELIARSLTGLGLIALAGAIVYFSHALLHISEYLPGVIDTVDSTVEKIDPIIHEVSEIRVLVPPLLDEVGKTRETIKPAIEQYAITNEQIPRIIEEYAATREMLPEMLPGLLKTADNLSFAVVTVTKEIGANRQVIPEFQQTADKAADALVIIAKQVEASQPLLPDMLKTADDVSNAVVVISGEIEAIRPLVPQILAEVEKTREMVPPALDKADRLVANARQAAKEASQGATSGFLSGLFMAPFVFVGDVGKKMVGFDSKEVDDAMNDEDYGKVENAASLLLEKGVEGDVQIWKNVDSGVNGKVTLRKVSYAEEKECRTLHFEVFRKQKRISEKTVQLCRTGSGKWDFVE